MNKLKVKWVLTRYYKNEWITGDVSIEEILQADNDFIKSNIDGEIKYKKRLNDYIKVAGNIHFSPELGKEYILYSNYIVDPKWGEQMQIVSINENTALETDEDKKFFLKQILTELQVKELYDKYENPFELLEKKDVQSLIQVNGIGEVMAKKLIKRFENTLDYAPAYVFFKKFELTDNMIRKLISAYKDPISAINEFKSNPYILVKDIDGIGFKRADEIALKYGIKEDNKNRIKSGIENMLLEVANNEGSTYVNNIKFKTDIVKLLGINFDIIIESFKEMVEEGILTVFKEDRRICLTKYYELEKNISKKLKEMLDAKSDIEINKDEIDIKIKQREEQQGFEFTEEQKDGIYKILKNNVCIITALSGSGKSSLISGALSTLPYNFSIAQTAFTGQAAKRINEITGFPASTIHRLLGYMPDKGFMYDEYNKLPYDVIILDEISMVSLDLFWYLIRAIKNDCKLVLIGDINQLPSISFGNLFFDLLNSEKVPTQRLTKIHRQASKSAIKTKSFDVKDGKQIVPINYNKEETVGELQDLTLFGTQNKDKIFNYVIDKYKEEYDSGKGVLDLQIIVPMRSRGSLSVNNFNSKIQEIVNPNGKEMKIGKDFILREGDKVINIKNNYDLCTIKYEKVAVFNGSVGIIKRIRDNDMVIDFIDIGEVIIPSSSYSSIQLAYANTSHKLQGQTINTIFVAFDNSAYIMLSKEWLYTSMTRASHKCYLAFETESIVNSVKRSSIKHRDTFLCELLIKESNDNG